MDTKLKIVICSDVDYDNLIAEIYYDDKFVALISQEEGPSKLKVEFSGPTQNEEAILRKVDLDWFQHALEEAKEKLIGEALPNK
jgi:hypothetical protein